VSGKPVDTSAERRFCGQKFICCILFESLVFDHRVEAPPIGSMPNCQAADRADGTTGEVPTCYRPPLAVAQAPSPCQTLNMPKKPKKITAKALIAKLKKEVEKRSSGKGVGTDHLFSIFMSRANAIDSVHQKVLALFSELVGERTARLGEPGAGETRKALATALSAYYPPDKARELAFHLADWHIDAAFIIAVHLFPERFTAEELCAGAVQLLVHVPNHLAAAAKLSGNLVSDIFEVGIFDDSDQGI
jgi:hypothetical protein